MTQSGRHPLTQEARRCYTLTDMELLNVILERGNDNRTLERLSFLVKMFETAAKANPQSFIGLNVAVGLTKLYAKSINAGAPDHPFRTFDPNATVQSIIHDSVMKAPAPPLKEPRKKVSRPEQDGPSLARDYDARFTNRMDFSGGAERDVPLTFPDHPIIDTKVRVFSDKGSLSSDMPSGQNAPRLLHVARRERADGQPKQWHRKGEPSKMDMVTVVIAGMTHFDKHTLLAAARARFPNVQESDVLNTIYKLIGKGQIAAIEGAGNGRGGPLRTYEVRYPCHGLDRNPCDSRGPGGFMGHTCWKFTDMQQRLVAAQVRSEQPFYVAPVEDAPSRFQEPA